MILLQIGMSVSKMSTVVVAADGRMTAMYIF